MAIKYTFYLIWGGKGNLKWSFFSGKFVSSFFFIDAFSQLKESLTKQHTSAIRWSHGKDNLFRYILCACQSYQVSGVTWHTFTGSTSGLSIVSFLANLWAAYPRRSVRGRCCDHNNIVHGLFLRTGEFCQILHWHVDLKSDILDRQVQYLYL